jgi:hypothetical protein
MRSLRRACAGGILAVLLSCVSFAAEPRAGRKFPPAGVDLVTHTLRVGLFVDKDGKGDVNRKPDEVLEFKGRMMLEREEARADQGKKVRVVPFRVRSWTASAYSTVLQQDLLYILSEDAEQPVSTITAAQEGRDYPATFSFNVIFDVKANNKTVFRRHHGRPEGRGFRVVPPDGKRENSPTLTRFEQELIAVDHPGIAGAKLIFKPIDCNDNSGRILRTIAAAPATPAS